MHHETQGQGREREETKRCDTGTCVKVIRNGDKCYLIDTKAYGTPGDPLVTTLSIEEYNKRLKKFRRSGDPQNMFDNKDQLSRFCAAELEAFAAYAAAGLLDGLADKQRVVAYSDMRDLQQTRGVRIINLIDRLQQSLHFVNPMNIRSI